MSLYPNIITETIDDHVFLKIVGWIDSDTPLTGYIGSSGITQDITDATNIRGSEGPIGDQGMDGAVGPIGPQGMDGAVGPIGPQGMDGAVGQNGADGQNGKDCT